MKRGSNASPSLRDSHLERFEVLDGVDAESITTDHEKEHSTATEEFIATLEVLAESTESTRDVVSESAGGLVDHLLRSRSELEEEASVLIGVALPDFRDRRPGRKTCRLMIHRLRIPRNSFVQLRIDDDHIFHEGRIEMLRRRDSSVLHNGDSLR